MNYIYQGQYLMSWNIILVEKTFELFKDSGMKRTQGEGKKKKVHKASSFFKTEKTLTDMKLFI